LVGLLQAQPYGGEYAVPYNECRADVYLETVLDSQLVCTLPANSVLVDAFIVVDSASGSALRLGISGEENSFARFANLTSDTLDAGTIIRINPYMTYQLVTGSLYFYNAERAITCTNANQPYTITAWTTGTMNNMSLSGDSGYVVRKYESGMYEISGGVSFYANKAAEAHAEVFRNAEELQNLVFQRTIGTASQVGNAGFISRVWLNEGDVIKMTIESTSANTVFTIDHAQFTVRKVQDHQNYYTLTEKHVMLYGAAPNGHVRIYLVYRYL